MATTVTKLCAESATPDSLERLAELCFRAKRVTIADDLHAVYHAAINDLLDELGL